MRHSLSFAAIALLCCSVSTDAVARPRPTARKVYGPLWFKETVRTGPCLLTVALPAKKDEGCTSFSRRESAGVAFHAPSGFLLVGGSDHQLHGMSAKNGEMRYKAKLPGALIARPTLSGNHAFFGTNEAHVLKTDITSGRIRWDITVDAEVIEPVRVHQGVVYVVTGLDTVYAFDAETGKGMWVQKHALPTGITLRGQARPLVVDVEDGAASSDEKEAPRVFIGHADGKMSVVDGITGRIVHQMELGKAEAFNDVDADPVHFKGTVFAASQNTGVFAIKADNFAVRWQNEERGIVRLATGGGRLVVGAGAGKIVAFDALTGKSRWRFTFKKGAPTRISVKGGRVHVASDRGSIYVLDLVSGEPLQYYGTGLGFAGDLEVQSDMLFAVSTAGHVHALSNAFAGKTQRKQKFKDRRPY
ncbi:MAG: PQQ-binding-like beta-propeller repeat protein [Deltaproteobacteria bacterium]|nr:PQQ-binding-like beta-propeller repeat protein [Deltaproteobacteria bacterium]